MDDMPVEAHLGGASGERCDRRHGRDQGATHYHEKV